MMQQYIILFEVHFAASSFLDGLRWQKVALKTSF